MHIITGLLISALLGRKNKTGEGKKGERAVGFRDILEVRHAIPGRIRLFAPLLKKSEEAARHLIKELSKARGIEAIHVEPATGTVLLLYDKEKLAETVVFGAVLQLLGLESEVEKRPESLMAAGIRDVSEAANRAIYEGSGGVIDLWTLVPMALAAYGLYRISKPGGLNVPGGFTLLWWAYMQLIAGRRRG
jgi:copper chaperone CopZ